MTKVVSPQERVERIIRWYSLHGLPLSREMIDLLVRTDPDIVRLLENYINLAYSSGGYVLDEISLREFIFIEEKERRLKRGYEKRRWFFYYTSDEWATVLEEFNKQ